MMFKKGIKGSYNKKKSYNKYNLFAQTSFSHKITIFVCQLKIFLE